MDFKIPMNMKDLKCVIVRRVVVVVVIVVIRIY